MTSRAGRRRRRWPNCSACRGTPTIPAGRRSTRWPRWPNRSAASSPWPPRRAARRTCRGCTWIYRGAVHRRLHRIGAGGQGLGRRPHHRPEDQNHAGVHPRRGRGLLPAASGRIQGGAVLRRHPRAHPRAGPARRGLRHRLRVRAPEQAVRRRRERVAVRGAAARRHRLAGLVRHRCPTGWLRWPHSTTAPSGGDVHRETHHLERRAAPPPGRRPRHRRAPAAHRLHLASEEARSVAQARERALATAEDALGRIRNGLGGRHYKTKKQVDDRVAKIISAHRRADHRHHRRRHQGKPTIAWHRNPEALTRASTLDGALCPGHQPARPTRGAP